MLSSFKNIVLKEFRPILQQPSHAFQLQQFRFAHWEKNLNAQYQRKKRQKHYHPEYRRLRALKFIKVELPNFQEMKNQNKWSIEEMRSKMKESGIKPERPWEERTFEVSSTAGAFEPYIPPEGDGKLSIISKAGAKQRAVRIEKKSKSYLAIRKIRSFEEDFDEHEFCDEAQKIYIKAHEVLTEKNDQSLRNIVTERMYPDIINSWDSKTIRWKFLESIEPPRVCHARCTDIITKDNIFGQITVRFHTKQTLAIYDRFGRLVYGSEVIAKDVLEYVVFEKHLSDIYGIWRIHEKIIPDWMGVSEAQVNTFKLPEPVVEKEKEEEIIDYKIRNEHTEMPHFQPKFTFKIR